MTNFERNPMRRSLLIAATAVALLVSAFSATAGAATTTSTCIVKSPNVVGGVIEGTLVAKDVDPSQAQFASCGDAREAMRQIADARIEEAGEVGAFDCEVVAVKKSRPPILSYSCTFKGADTATSIQLTFAVKFRLSTPCATSSPNVIGGKVTGRLSARNVNPVQAGFATCANAKKAMKKITGAGVEKPRSAAGLYCLPTVLRTEPDLVRYVCTFRGADTPMFVKLVFTVAYKLD
jgi:hypothetical protein